MPVNKTSGTAISKAKIQSEAMIPILKQFRAPVRSLNPALFYIPLLFGLRSWYPN